MRHIWRSLLIITLIAAVVMSSGCAQDNSTKENRISGAFQNRNPGGERQFASNMTAGAFQNRNPGGERQFASNMTEEQRNMLLEERENACATKAENDPCAIITQRGEMPGTCQKTENNLVCAIQRRQTP
ncbi:MAG: hypothetical protein ABIG84_02700 [archaeon]